jgi:hypothetical protein
MQLKNRYIILCLLLSLSFLFSFTPVAQASVCRSIDDRLICLVSIKRSAKNYWEYRAVISVDGKKQPMEIYNCRDRLRVTANKTTVAFKANGFGELICSFFAK